MEVCRTLGTKKTKACKHASKPLEKNSRVVLCNDNVASGTDLELEELERTHWDQEELVVRLGFGRLRPGLSPNL
jgi:hypothetical protein